MKALVNTSDVCMLVTGHDTIDLSGKATVPKGRFNAKASEFLPTTGSVNFILG